MVKTLRWFGEGDSVTLDDIRQTGATGVVTALHHIPNGEVWTVGEIRKVKEKIESYGLTWEVVESLPVTEEIKQGLAERESVIDNYIKSMRNLAGCGIKTIVYNFMPVLDWARTNLHYKLSDGREAMYFSAVDFAVFDLFILKRPGAERDYTAVQVARAKKRFGEMTNKQAEELAYNIIVVTQGFIDGVVDRGSENYKELFLSYLAKYDKIGKKELRDNLVYFLKRVIPVAEEVGINMAIHPDDPPFDLLGLPRIMSTAEDFEWLAEVVPSVHNGFTLCAGSLSARSDNDIPAMAEQFAGRLHFVHLRSTKRLGNGDFYEAGHLEGDVNLVEVIHTLHKIMHKTHQPIPVRPDHGHRMLDDFHRDSNPGYPLIGRMKALAEISAIEKAVKYFMREM
ncbi:MAG: mannonate dehydratase [Chlorobi bacterium]|nr:mannonate dehydratase [Chlorobiota bacterium]